MEFLPLFMELGISKQELLSLKHYDIENIINGYYRHRASNLLALTDAVFLGAGMLGDEDSRKKVIKNLTSQAKFPVRKRKLKVKYDASNHNWVSDLKNFAQGMA